MSDTSLQSFRDLGVTERLLSALAAKGFTEPTPIQALVIPKLLTGTGDLIGQAQTGTGKTAAFGIPILERAEEGLKKPQALVLSPTRELSMQIADELNSLKGDLKLSIASFYGGQPIGIQLDRLKKGVDVVIGTPGRIQDLLDRQVLDLSGIRCAVLDEADEMLDMGFVEDMKAILGRTPETKQTLMFSATMPDPIKEIAAEFMPDFELVRAEAPLLNTDLTEQSWYEVRLENKFDALCRLLDVAGDGCYAMIFCKTRVDVIELTEKLQQRRYRVDALHGDIAQLQRTRVIKNFKEKRFQLLVATDVAARGIDVNDLTHVINYSMPDSAETYVHRIGRTARAGKKGEAITLVTPGQVRKFHWIETDTKAKIEKRELPGGDAVIALKFAKIAEHLGEMVECGLPAAYKEFASTLLADPRFTPETLAAALLKLHYRDELDPARYPDLSAPRTDRRRSNDVRLRLDVGHADGLNDVRDLLETVRDRTGIPGRMIGRIDIRDRETFLCASREDADRILKAFGADSAAGFTVSEAPALPKEEKEREDRKRTPRAAGRAPLRERPGRDTKVRRRYGAGDAIEDDERRPYRRHAQEESDGEKPRRRYGKTAEKSEKNRRPFKKDFDKAERPASKRAPKKERSFREEMLSASTDEAPKRLSRKDRLPR